MNEETVILTYQILDYIRSDNDLTDPEYVYYKYLNHFIKINIKDYTQTKLNKIVNFIIEVLNNIILNKDFECMYATFEENIEYLNNDKYIDEVEKFIINTMSSYKVKLNDIDQNIKIWSIDDVINELDRVYPGILFGG